MTPEEIRIRHRAACKAYRERNADKCNAYAKAYRLARKESPPPQPTEKACAHCMVIKPRSEFSKRSRVTGQRPTRGALGVDNICKACRSHRRKPALVVERQTRKTLHAAQLKKCTKCLATKPFASFSKRIASNDGLTYTCRECAKARLVRHRAANPASFENWYQRNKQRRDTYTAQYRLKRKAELAKNYAQWAKANPGNVNANRARRIAAKRHATPPWCDLDAIRSIYHEASAITRATGVRHEVDHIVPLQGRDVCGLHVSWNLQILTETENIRKSNRFTTHEVPVPTQPWMLRETMHEQSRVEIPPLSACLSRLAV